MKILVLCGDPWHPPHVVREGLAALVVNEYSFDWIEDARDLTPAILKVYPLVILAKSDNVSEREQAGWMTDPIQESFSRYVREGKGLLALHSGTAGYEQKPILRGLLGGVFLRHPDPCPVSMNPRPEHPLCDGSTPFTLNDEQYFMALDDPEVDVFLTTTSLHGEQPGGWRRDVGNGRVVVLTPGHSGDVWMHPSYQVILRNSIRWCAS